jgi:hypothetical protein
VEAGQKDAPAFVVKLAGQFTGEISALFGRRILVRVRGKEAGEVIEIDCDRLRASGAERVESLHIPLLARRVDATLRKCREATLYGADGVVAHN